MLDWYLTRTGNGLTHRGQKLPEGKKVRLTEDQVKLINRKEEKVAKTDAPVGPQEVAIFSEWHDWQKNITQPQFAEENALIEEAVESEPEKKKKRASRDKNTTENKGQVNPSRSTRASGEAPDGETSSKED